MTEPTKDTGRAC